MKNECWKVFDKSWPQNFTTAREKSQVTILAITISSHLSFQHPKMEFSTFYQHLFITVSTFSTIVNNMLKLNLSSDNSGNFSFMWIMCYHFNLTNVNANIHYNRSWPKATTDWSPPCPPSPTRSQRSPTPTPPPTTMLFWWNSPTPFTPCGWKTSRLRTLRRCPTLTCLLRSTLPAGPRCATRAVKAPPISSVCSVIAPSASGRARAGKPISRLSRPHIPSARMRAISSNLSSPVWTTCFGTATIATMGVWRATSSSTASTGSSRPTAATSPTRARCAAGRPYGRGRQIGRPHLWR